MKNFKIYEGLKRGISYKIAALTLTGVLTATSLTGCGKSNKTNDYSLTSVYEGLSLDKANTYVDEYIASDELSLEKLDNTFIKAYLDEDLHTCNNNIKLLCDIILKAMVVEGYGFDYNKIKDFNVTGHFFDFKRDNKNETISEYGLSFNYEGENYDIRAKKGLPYDVCCVARAALKNELKFTDTTHNLNIMEAYNTLKRVLSKKLIYEDKEYQLKVKDGIIFSKTYYGKKFTGTFDFEKDSDKANTINSYLKLVNTKSLKK